MKAFFNDWKDYFFDINKPEQGQCFWIKTDDKKIGVVCYSEFDKQNKKTELDIILGDKEDLGKGYGVDAIKALIKYLFMNFNLNKIWIEARGNNPRAIKAYQKAGFQKEGLLKEEDYFNGEFVDCVRFGILRNEV